MLGLQYLGQNLVNKQVLDRMERIMRESCDLLEKEAILAEFLLLTQTQILADYSLSWLVGKI